MAQGSSSGTVSPLVYPQVRGPGLIGWFMACWIGFIGGGFIVLSIIVTLGAVQGKIKMNGPPVALGIFLLFGLIGLGVVTRAAAIVLHRHCIVVDPQTRTVTRRRSWGPFKRTIVLSGEVSAVRLMHDTLRSGKNGGGFRTVCQLKVVTRRGELWQLSQRPEAGEALRQWLRPWFLHRTTPDYEQLLRDEALKLCAATGWRLDDRFERSTTGFVPAASAPRAQKVEDLKSLLMDAPAWLQRPAPRRVRRRGQTVLLRVPGWSVVVVPLVVTALGVGADALSVKLIPSILVTIAIAVVMCRRASRIARAVVLGQRGRMSQGMVFRRAQRAGQTRTSTRLTMNGLPVHLLLQSVENNPNQIRYEFIVDGKKRFGYVAADLLGIFRSDGLVGVVYDPLNPELHLPLPVIERYLTIE